jgi:enoyl-CoA hydratase
MSYLHLLTRKDGGVLTVVLNRPRVLNALSADTVDELEQAMIAAEADPAVGAVVLTGAGDRAFSAGADLTELCAESAVGARARARRTQAVFSRIEHLSKPVIAAVNGIALGGGCELAMACAIRIAASEARFGQPEITLGLMPGYGGTQRLPRLIGRGRALEWLLTGEPVAADEAWRVGLLNRVVPQGELLSEAGRLAATMAGRPAVARRYVLQAVVNGAEMAPAAAADYEAALFGLTFATEDMREGTDAFLKKRAPEFKGR